LIRPTHIEDFFSRYGWNISLASPSVWNSGFLGNHGFYPLKASLTDTFLALEVCPLIEYAPNCDSCADPWDERFLKAALQFNNDLQFVKLGLNIKGQLTLSCQIINIDLDYEKFSTVVGVLGYYCDELRSFFNNLLDASPQKGGLQA